ncbi:uncharacterized protein [Diabrotica undecimpunctata]|uniref:uncharacterized protein n=1 Tax=Diabrotica undecimpunctata TaxID=50387 RepID=UPI003B63C9F0
MTLLFTLLLVLIFQNVTPTIDLNTAELQYLADHLTKEECRRLIAAAHFNSYEEPAVLGQAERKVPKDLTCIQLLHHWNSEPNEGKGETHEVLAHRLRQMGKYKLADWLGRTVFHELAVDLNKTMEKGFKVLMSENYTTDSDFGPTLIPVIKNQDPSEYSFVDNLLLAIIIGLLATTIGLLFKVIFDNIRQSLRKKKTKKNVQEYDIVEDFTGSSESEDKFDLRDYTQQNISDAESVEDTITE